MMALKNGKFGHFFVQTLHSKIDISHKKWINWSAFCYTPHFQSAFGTADHDHPNDVDITLGPSDTSITIATRTPS